MTNMLDLSKEPRFTKDQGFTDIPWQPELAAVRSHFTSIYIAFASIALNVSNASAFSVEQTGFSTTFDGGSGTTAENNMWHLWGESSWWEECNTPIKWIFLHGEYEWVFETTLPQNSHGYQEINDFHNLWQHVYSDILTENMKRYPAGTHLKASQMEWARNFEREYFARWGQGHDRQLFGDSGEEENED